MSSRSIIGTHPFWGSYADAASLPNTAAGKDVNWVARMEIVEVIH